MRKIKYLLLIILFLFPNICFAEVLNLDDINLKLSIDDSADIFTRNNISGNPNLNKYNFTESDLKKVLEKGNIVAYEIKGAIMAIRKDDTKNIMVIK